VDDNTLYIANAGLNNVCACSKIPTMSGLGTCRDIRMSSKGVGVQGLAINGDWLHITYTETNNVFMCRLATLTTTGTSPCEDTGADLLTNPMILAFPNDGFTYITSAQRLIYHQRSKAY